MIRRGDVVRARGELRRGDEVVLRRIVVGVECDDGEFVV